MKAQRPGTVNHLGSYSAVRGAKRAEKAGGRKCVGAARVPPPTPRTHMAQVKFPMSMSIVNTPQVLVPRVAPVGFVGIEGGRKLFEKDAEDGEKGSVRDLGLSGIALGGSELVLADGSRMLYSDASGKFVEGGEKEKRKKKKPLAPASLSPENAENVAPVAGAGEGKAAAGGFGFAAFTAAAMSSMVAVRMSAVKR